MEETAMIGEMHAATDATVRFHPRKHAAARTDDYLFNQLIPYIGNKRRLLHLIRGAVLSTGLESGSFLDLFAGTGVVSRLAKTMGFTVLCNDWEHYSYATNRCFIGLNAAPGLATLRRALGLSSTAQVFGHLNGCSEAGYITEHYCPADDDRPDPATERMFYTNFNGRRLDGMRDEIESWRSGGLIDDGEMCYLLAPLIYRAAYVSNTSGVFKAYHKGWGGSKGIALHRIRSAGAVDLTTPVLFDNGKSNAVTGEDASVLVDRLCERGRKVDVCYLDPPYNQHQYGTNYHLLNTVSLGDKPPVNKAFNLDGRVVRKSAIRSDWNKSLYCYRDTAFTELASLLERIKADYLVMSYSSDGIIGTGELVELLASRGRLRVTTERYKRYRVSSERYSETGHNLESAFVVETGSRSSRSDVEAAVMLLKCGIDDYRKTLPVSTIIYNCLKARRIPVAEEEVVERVAELKAVDSRGVRAEVVSELRRDKRFTAANGAWMLRETP
jgi:adenine-specific DNA-methyltransferase